MERSTNKPREIILLISSLLSGECLYTSTLLVLEFISQVMAILLVNISQESFFSYRDTSFPAREIFYVTPGHRNVAMYSCLPVRVLESELAMFICLCWLLLKTRVVQKLFS